eukprot:4358162-Pyramimonas_sp.AAC.1
MGIYDSKRGPARNPLSSAPPGASITDVEDDVLSCMEHAVAFRFLVEATWYSHSSHGGVSRISPRPTLSAGDAYLIDHDAQPSDVETNLRSDQPHLGFLCAVPP